MGPAHDWVAANMPELPRGLIRMRSFHMAPDRGMTIMWFNNQKNLIMRFLDRKNSKKLWLQDLKLAVMPKKVLRTRSLIMATNIKNFNNSFFSGTIFAREIGNA